MRLPAKLRENVALVEKAVVSWMPGWVSPNTITIFGGVLNVILLALFYFGSISYYSFLWLFFLTQIFDVLDGMVARVRGLASVFGQRLDTAIDMLSGLGFLFVLFFSGFQIELVWIVALTALYGFRFLLVLKGKDLEVGGYKNALVTGFLLTYYLFLPGMLVVQLVVIFNMLVIGLALSRK